MARVRVSTTVDAELLEEVRSLRKGCNDATLLDEALSALRARCRSTAIDDMYAEAYADEPFDAPDEWGDLASFGAANHA